jgi:hypothetical protein
VTRGICAPRAERCTLLQRASVQERSCRFEATVQARDPKPDRPRTHETGDPRHAPGLQRPIVPATSGRPDPRLPYRPDPRLPYRSDPRLPYRSDPRLPYRSDPRLPYRPPQGRVATRPAPRQPAITHGETGQPRRWPGIPAGRGTFGLPSLRRNVCPHFYVSGSRGAIPIQAPHLLKALIRQEQNVSRCQLRGGVHLEQGFVNDVCLTPRFNQCVFYEDDLTKD